MTEWFGTDAFIPHGHCLSWDPDLMATIVLSNALIALGLQGEIVGIDHFGASAPAKDLFKAYGFTPEHVVAAIEKVLTK